MSVNIQIKDPISEEWIIVLINHINDFRSYTGWNVMADLFSVPQKGLVHGPLLGSWLVSFKFCIILNLWLRLRLRLGIGLGLRLGLGQFKISSDT